MPAIHSKLIYVLQPQVCFHILLTKTYYARFCTVNVINEFCGNPFLIKMRIEQLYLIRNPVPCVVVLLVDLIPEVRCLRMRVVYHRQLGANVQQTVCIRLCRLPLYIALG